MGDLIIEAPHMMEARQRYGMQALTLFFWLLWIWLWRPLVGFIAWFVFGGAVHYEMVEKSGYIQLLAVLATYTAIIFIIATVLEGWAMYNYVRFKDSDRRRAVQPLSVEEAADSHGLDPNDLRSWRSARRMVLHHGPEGHVEKVEASLMPSVAGQTQHQPV